MFFFLYFLQFSWYSKRALLAAIYKSTELSMIQDRSEDFIDTWEFLDRRIEGVMKKNVFVQKNSY